MPELPEVETTKTSLSPFIGNELVELTVFQPKLRWMIPSDIFELSGYRLDDVSRRAKYLILDFRKGNNNRKLIIHLGMSGSLQQRGRLEEKFKHDHVIFEFSDNDYCLHYHDPRRFGSILWYRDYASKLLDHLAPEPLSEAFNAEYLHKKLQKTARPIKVTLMDQAYVVGVGNIYATECLFLSNIHPLTDSNKLTLAQTTELVLHIKSVLAKAIELGGSSLSDFTFATGKTGYFQQTLYAYGRSGEACESCGDVLETIKITGRASCFCPSCQPLL